MTTAQATEFRTVDNLGEMHIRPSAPQYKLMVSEAEIAGMQAGAQSGKTSALVQWLYDEMDRAGPGDYMTVAPTFPLMEPRLIPELLDLFHYKTGWGVYRPGYHRFESYEKQKETQAPAYRILLGSAVNPDSLESATIKAAIVDELAQTQFPLQSWEALQRRVNLNDGRIRFGTTLYDVSSWYKTRIYDRWKAGDPRFEIIQADSTTNPMFPRERYEQAKRDLPWWKFNMFYRGIYEKPTGLIYDAFDEETNFIPAFDLKLPQYQEWPRYVGHDFGPNNTAAVWLAQDPGTGHLYVYRSYHRGGLSVGQHAAEFKRLSQSESVRQRVGGSWAEEEARYAYTAAGWPIFKPAIRDVEAGIDQVYSFVAKNQLFVFDSCQEFLDEIMSYTRVLDDSYEVTDKIVNKSRFHLMDSLRYIMSSFSPERTDWRKEPYMKVTREGRGKRRQFRHGGRQELAARRR